VAQPTAEDDADHAEEQQVVDVARVHVAPRIPGAGDNLPRHPSQLYQFALEGIALFAILWLYSRKPRIPGTVGSLFLIAYGVLRIIGEMFKEPEALYGTMPLGWSAGQWLSAPMVVAGLGFYLYFTRFGKKS
jgi:phosphatidylglycerol:prolipoprotein diacylglycerol transferase